MLLKGLTGMGVFWWALEGVDVRMFYVYEQAVRLGLQRHNGTWYAANSVRLRVRLIKAGAARQTTLFCRVIGLTVH